MEKLNVRFSDKAVERMKIQAERLNVSLSQFARAAVSIATVEIEKMNVELAKIKIENHKK